MAGPMIRAVSMITLFRLTALTRRSGPTISITKLCRVGLSTQLTAPKRKTRDVDHPRLLDAEDGDEEEAGGRDRHQRLGDEEEVALREAVGEQAAVGAEEEHRQELQGGGEADREAGVGQA